MRPPVRLVHCDWSTSPGKRWMSRAIRRDEGQSRYRLGAPEPVGPVENLLADLLREPGPVLAGFDFPIGLPLGYGLRTGRADFRAFLEALAAGDLPGWFEVVDDARDLSVARPFYPARPGGRSHAQLLEKLGVARIDDLRRACERSTPARRAACPLFWTLGANQVGKAAIAGWRDIVLPALAQPGTALWPFDGALPDLLAGKTLVIAETYPADAYGQIGLRFGKRTSKRRRRDRLAVAEALLAWAAARGHDLAADLDAAIRDGFGDDAHGEDRFDAVLGLCGMLDVVGGHIRPGEPAWPEIRSWEGWILGQDAGHLQPRARDGTEQRAASIANRPVGP